MTVSLSDVSSLAEQNTYFDTEWTQPKNPIKGILFGIMLSVPIWAGILETAFHISSK